MTWKMRPWKARRFAWPNSGLRPDGHVIAGQARLTLAGGGGPARATPATPFPPGTPGAPARVSCACSRGDQAHSGGPADSIRLDASGAGPRVPGEEGQG
jgi:hypothetical protein